MTILVAPLNWGLGHASRCVPIVQRLLDEGHEVILGGDGESLTLLRRHFPKLRYTYLAPLNLRYSEASRQVWAMIRAIPKLVWWALKDHAMLRALLREEHIDQVISDNRFGLYSKSTECIYVTHQLHIMLPKGWRWAESIASRIHARIYTRFNKVWVPDYAEKEQCLAGELSHPDKSFVDRTSALCTLSYIGPQSRLKSYRDVRNGHEMVTKTAVVLSGLEPQRTLLEREIVERYQGKEESVLIVQGLMHRPNTRIKRGYITMVPYLSDAELAKVLLGAKHIIARSGYSTIMDLNALGLLQTNGQQPIANIELIPTPGQPEQAYLAHFIAQKCTSK